MGVETKMLGHRTSTHARKGHGLRVLEVGHDDGRDGEHEAAHDLLGIVVQLRVGEANARTIQGDPGTPNKVEIKTILRLV